MKSKRQDPEISNHLEQPSLHVLIVEDSELDAELMVMNLQQGGIRCIWQRVDNEKDYLQALETPRDLILSDWSMPQFNGLKALQLKQSRGIDTPFIIVSGSIGEETAVTLMQQGAADYVMKDRMVRLAQAAKNALEQHQLKREVQNAEAQIRLQAAALTSAANSIVITDASGIIQWVNPAFTSLTGYSAEEALGRDLRILKSGEQTQEFYQNLWETITAGKVWQGELINRRKDGSLYTEEQTITPLRNAQGQITQYIAIKQDITRRKQAEAALIKHLQIQTSLASLGRELVNIHDITNICRSAHLILKTIMPCPYFCVDLMSEDQQSLKKVYAVFDSVEVDVQQNVLINNFQADSLRWQAIQKQTPILASDPKAISASASPPARSVVLHSACYLPMEAEESVLGVITLMSPKPQEYLPDDLEWLSVFAHQVGLSIQNAKLFTSNQQRLAELSALAVIDSAVISRFDSRTLLTIILEQALSRLKADAACVFLYNPKTNLLERSAQVGFLANQYPIQTLQVGEGLAGKAVLHNRLLHLDLLEGITTHQIDPKFVVQGFQDYYGVPLYADAQLVGVLEIWNRVPMGVDTGWLRFLEILSNQAAIAINTLSLYNNLSQAHSELLNAYDLTIEGWSRAMDIRDKDTEDHTRRVTDLTLRLAKGVGIPEEQLIHIRRGALLHDIGKLGVPDRILWKEGSLTPEEWEIMRRHPLMAFEMLYPIEYLRPALDIPYCHHEKWDGSGYPRGLTGNEIPLPARLFALADVYDALTSDRPYRKAWSHDQAVQYIREQRGKHFDPEITDIFLSLLESEPKE